MIYKKDKYEKLVDNYYNLLEITRDIYPDDIEVDLAIKMISADLELFKQEQNDELYNIILNSYNEFKKLLMK